MQPSFRLKNEPDSNRPMVLTKLSGGPGGVQIPIQRYQWEHSPKIMSMLKGLEIWTNVMEGSSHSEFPKGIYYYVVTDDFPFFTRCLKGDFRLAQEKAALWKYNCFIINCSNDYSKMQYNFCI